MQLIGLYDMIGNVWEWTSTIFKTNHMSDGNRIRDKNHRPQYVVKGGSFVDSRDGSSNLEARCAARYVYNESLCSYLQQNHNFSTCDENI